MSFDSMPAHDRDMESVTRREGPPAQKLVSGARDRVEIHRQHLIDHRQENIERRLDGIGSSDRPEANAGSLAGPRRR